MTGGEPMIAPEIVALTQRLRDAGLHITIETAGTVFDPVACDLMSISPKLANSTPEDPSGRGSTSGCASSRTCSRELMARYEYQLKFVIAQPEDLERSARAGRLAQGAAERVMLMPEGTDREPAARARPLAGRNLQGRGLPLQSAAARGPLGRPERSLRREDRD